LSDKKKAASSDDLKGFEELIQPPNQQRPGEITPGKNAGGEHFTFLLQDGDRLQSIVALVSDKVPMLRKFSQGEKLLESQTRTNARLRAELFAALDAEGAPLQRSMAEVFDGFFGKTR
jgi:hypothetical protein